MARFENQQPPFVWKNIAGKSSRNAYSEILDTMDKVDWFSTNIEFCTNDRISHRNTFRTTYYNSFLNTKYNHKFSSRLTNQRTILYSYRYSSIRNARNSTTYTNVCSNHRNTLCSTIWNGEYKPVYYNNKYYVGYCPQVYSHTYNVYGTCVALYETNGAVCWEHDNNNYNIGNDITSTANYDNDCTTDHGTYYGSVHSSFNSDVYANNHNVYNGVV